MNDVGSSSIVGRDRLFHTLVEKGLSGIIVAMFVVVANTYTQPRIGRNLRYEERRLEALGSLWGVIQRSRMDIELGLTTKDAKMVRESVDRALGGLADNGAFLGVERVDALLRTMTEPLGIGLGGQTPNQIDLWRRALRSVQLELERELRQ